MSADNRPNNAPKWFRRALVCFVFVATASAPLWWNAAGFAQERQAERQQQTPPGEQDMAEMMKMFEEAARPGEFHELLKPYAGKWEVSAIFGPPEAQQSSRGHATNKWVLGDRFLMQEFGGKMMGQQFSGIGYTGYDNTSRQYQSVWMDSMSSAMFVITGEASEDGKTITMTGQAMNPMTRQLQNYRHVQKLVSNDQYIYEMYEPGPDGEMMKTATLTYTRVE